ncbi:endolytic transglycosylase MltG [Nocardia sp. NPDC051570]|uniref:endolytic transglycosylase MltG n=1 Tax=Nocardia sp. NPDC051570 TaxID=3364324 RepID=UPI0037A21229
MNDRWARAEERARQRTEERRYRRSDYDWGDAERTPPSRGGARHAAPTDDWDDYEDDTTVIPRYTDDQEPPARPPGGRAAPRGSAGRTRHAKSEDWDTDEQAWDTDERDDWDADTRSRAWHDDRSEDWAGEDHEDWDDEDHVTEQTTRARGRSGARAGRAAARARGRGESGRGQTRGRRSRSASRKAAERKRRRRNLLVLGGILALLLVVAGGYVGYKLIGKLGGPEDFAGPPGPVTVVHVRPGDISEQIAKTMADKGVVASTGAFYEAAVRNSGMTAVQPGYYALPTHIKGADAVAALLERKNRVGNVVIPEGKRLHDSTDVTTHARNQGIYGKIAEASCMGTGAEKKCVTAEQLDEAGASTDPTALGVPAWALDAVRHVPDRSRQLEGLIAAGALDFDPTGSPTQILAQLISQSAQMYESTGLLQSGAANHLSPYQTLIGASLVEREAQPKDMPMVARVIVNRLESDDQDDHKLRFDSTVNYTLDSIEVQTDSNDRYRPTPWNTYVNPGLPVSPIASPSLDALKAMDNPKPGPWKYFVTINKQGETRFTADYAEHLRNVKLAEQSGILDSGKSGGR